MAGLISSVASQGQTCYAILWDEANNVVYNGATFVTYAEGDWATYALTLTEHTGSGFYTRAFPAVAAGLYRWITYIRLGGSPAPGDTPVDTEPFVSWDGTKVVTTSPDVNITSIAGSTTAATKLGTSAGTMVTGLAQAGTLSTTQMTTNLTNTHAGAYIGRILIWTSGVLINQATAITAYTVSGGKLGFTAVTNAPSAGDTFIIV